MTLVQATWLELTLLHFSRDREVTDCNFDAITGFYWCDDGGGLLDGCGLCCDSGGEDAQEDGQGSSELHRS